MTRRVLAGSAMGIVIALTGGGIQSARAADAQAVNPAPIRPSNGAMPVSFADVVERVAPAVVSIDIELKSEMSFPTRRGVRIDRFSEPKRNANLPRPFQERPVRIRPLRASGSGFFISTDGFIVTNNHVVEHAAKINVRLSDERTFQAKIVGRDPATDLAVIKVDAQNLPFVNLHDRAKPRVGDWVVAVGNPFNFGGTATAGIVSALKRPNMSGSNYVDYLQIDAPINLGNSGGPTFDLQGRVVGVNSAIFSPSGGSVGIGFDIPADVAASVAEQLISNGSVRRGYIGVVIQNLTPEIAESLDLTSSRGALVAEINVDGPADEAGLKAGDIVTRLNGVPVVSAADLTRQVAIVQGGEMLSLNVIRTGRPLLVRVRSGLRPSEASLVATPRSHTRGENVLGLTISPNSGGGLKVERVSQESDAAWKGLRPGDVIKRVANRDANTPEDLRAKVATARSMKRKSVLLLVDRSGRRFFVPLAVPEAGKG